MSKLLIKAGATSRMIEVFATDATSAVGAGLTGLTNATANLSAAYYREGANAAVTISLVAGTVGTWASGGFVAVDAVKLPGLYQLGLPNAALAAAAGVESVKMMLFGAANMAPVPVEIQLVGLDLFDAVSAGLSRLDAAISSRSLLSAPDVRAEVAAALTVDALAELALGVPPAAPTVAQAQIGRASCR